MAQSTVSILVQARDQASATVGKLSKNISADIGAMGKQVKDALNGASVALTGIGVGLTAYSKQSLDYAMELNGQVKALARQTGLTVTEGSRLTYAIQRMGVGAEGASQIFNVFAKNIEKADGPLSDLKIKTENADKSQRGFRDILLDVADKFAKMENGTEKTALALQLFGRQGSAMIPILNKGRDGIIELEKTADKLGVTLTDKSSEALTAYAISQKNLAESTGALKMQVGALTAPVLTNLNNTIQSLTTRLVGADSPFKDLIANVIAFGGPVASAAGVMIGFIANVGTINSGLGAFAGIALAAATAIIGSGGLFIALSRFMGLNFEPLRASLDRLFDGFINASGRGVDSARKFADSPAWKKIQDKGNQVIVKLADSIDRVTKALNDGGLSAGIAAIGGEFKKIDLNSIMNTVLDKLIEFPWADHASKIITGLITMLDVIADNTAEFITQATPALLAIGLGIIDGLIAGIINYAITNPLDFVLLLVSLGFMPAKVLKAFGLVLSKIPILGPMLDWVMQAFAMAGNLLLAPVKAVFGKVGGAIVQSFKDGFVATFGGFRFMIDDALNGVKGAAMAAFNFVKNINWGAAISGASRGIGNAIISLIEGAINGALSGIPGKPKINIPRFYTGKRNFEGGLAVVGDVNGRGGELLNLPRGTDIFGNRESKAMMGGGRGLTIGKIEIHNNVQAKKVVSDIGWMLRTAG